MILAWRGVDPDRLETWVRERRLLAHGSSTTADYVLTWRLETEEGWITRDLRRRRARAAPAAGRRRSVVGGRSRRRR